MKRYLVILFLVFLSCTDKKLSFIKTSDNYFRDSIIAIKNEEIILANIDSLLAREILYKHFRSKGQLIESELDFETFNPELPNNKGKKAIDLLKLYNISINNFGSKIISYYYCEPFLNGNCVQPHFAIISKTTNGYKIFDEDFLPSTFKIDSIVKHHNTSYVYAFNFDCSNHKKLKSYRIILQ